MAAWSGSAEEARLLASDPSAPSDQLKALGEKLASEGWGLQTNPAFFEATLALLRNPQAPSETLASLTEATFQAWRKKGPSHGLRIAEAVADNPAIDLLLLMGDEHAVSLNASIFSMQYLVLFDANAELLGKTFPLSMKPILGDFSERHGVRLKEAKKGRKSSTTFTLERLVFSAINNTFPPFLEALSDSEFRIAHAAFTLRMVVLYLTTMERQARQHFVPRLLLFPRGLQRARAVIPRLQGEEADQGQASG